MLTIVDIKTVLIFVCALNVAIAHDQAAEFESLRTDVDFLKTIISDLRHKIAKMEGERDSTAQFFDCYRTANLSANGIISFNGCSVDTTTGDPWSGTFIVQEPGIYRFTFEGLVSHTATGLPGGTPAIHSGHVYLLVDGLRVASALVREDVSVVPKVVLSSLSINTMQVLNAGQSVTLEYEGDQTTVLESDADKYVHFTGEYVAPASVFPPQCEETGQTFEYPGSCRKYYLCEANGTIELLDCCPDAFDPTSEACVSEDESGNLCNEEDTCAILN